MNPPIRLPKFNKAFLRPMRLLWEHAPDMTAKQIAERFAVTKNTVIGQAARGQWAPRGTSRPQPVKQKPAFTGKQARHPARLEARLSAPDMASMRGLWDAGTPISHIARQFGVSASALRNLVDRLEWWPYPTIAELTAPEPRTLHDRMDTEHARMDAVLAETRGAVEGREKRYEPFNRGEWTEDRRLKAAARLRALNGNKAQRAGA